MAGEDPLEFAFQVDRFMRRLNARVHAQAPEFDREKVGPIGGMILMTLAEVQPAPMQQIATMMGRDKAQLSRMFSSLERKGLVARSANADDQRSSLLSLTPEGDALVVAIKRAVGGAVGELLAPLEPKERVEMLRLLAKT